MQYISIIALVIAAVSASPVQLETRSAKLSLGQVNTVKSVKNLVAKGQARIAAFNGLSASVGPTADVASGPVTNEDVSYVAPVIIGGTTYSLIVDTGCKSNLSEDFRILN